jgi:4-amino-4-deoxy-L-arabinose transferase-like glycosyltransferase
VRAALDGRRATVLVGLALAAAAAFVFGRALGTRTNYDEGVYLASLQLLREGETLGGDVYTPQPPVFYWILRALASPFGSSVEGIRAGFVALAVIGVLAAFAAAKQLYGLAAGTAAGFFLVVAPPFPSVAADIAADMPSLALALVSLAVVARAVQPTASPMWAIGAGTVGAAALLTKFLAAPILVALLTIPLAARAGRRLLPLIAAGAVAFAAVVVLVHLGSLEELWTGAVSDHEGAKSLSRVGDNVDRLRYLLELRTPFGWLVPAGAVAFAVSRNARRSWPLAVTVPVAALFTLYVRPLPDHHLSLMACAYAIAAGPALALGVESLRPRAREVAAAVAVVFVAMGIFQEQRRELRNDVPEPPEVEWATRAIEGAVPAGRRFTTDVPIVSFRTGRLIPGYLTDTSSTRLRSRALTPADVLREIETSDSRAVLVGRIFRDQPELLAALRRRFPAITRCGGATLYLPAEPAIPLPACPT